MVRSYRYNRTLTLRIVTQTDGAVFATSARVEALDTGEVLHCTDARPLGLDSAAMDDARAWLDRQAHIRTEDGTLHHAARPVFVGRTGSGRGYRVYVDGGKAVRATVLEEWNGEWAEKGPADMDHVPAEALQRIGVAR